MFHGYLTFYKTYLRKNSIVIIEESDMKFRLIGSAMFTAGLCIAIYGNITFSKNGQPMFAFGSDGIVWGQSGFYGNQADPVQAGEIVFRKSGSQRLWTRNPSGREVHFTGDWITNGTMPSSGLLFRYGGSAKQAISDAGDFYSAADIQLTVNTISFNWNNGDQVNDALNIRKDFTTTVTVPEYQPGFGINDPAAYIKTTAVSIKASFSVQPNSVSSLQIIGISTDANGSLGSTIARTVTFDAAGNSPEVEILVSGYTPDAAWKSDDYWMWSIVDGGTVLPCASSGPHRIYTIMDVPQAPWNQLVGNTQNPWQSALDFAIDPSGCNMQGATTVEAAVAKAGTFLFNSFGLTYDINWGSSSYHSMAMATFSLTAYLTQANGNIVNCYDQAGAISTFAALIGGVSMYRYMDPFGYLPITNLIGVGLTNNPFYITKPPPYNDLIEDLDELNRSRFGNHAFMKMSNVIYDACGGPHLGTENEPTYVDNAVDRSTPDEAAVAGSITDIEDRPITGLN